MVFYLLCSPSQRNDLVSPRLRLIHNQPQSWVIERWIFVGTKSAAKFLSKVRQRSPISLTGTKLLNNFPNAAKEME